MKIDLLLFKMTLTMKYPYHHVPAPCHKEFKYLTVSYQLNHDTRDTGEMRMGTQSQGENLTTSKKEKEGEKMKEYSMPSHTMDGGPIP